jgi:hypothetical protein
VYGPLQDCVPGSPPKAVIVKLVIAPTSEQRYVALHLIVISRAPIDGVKNLRRPIIQSIQPLSCVADLTRQQHG